MRIVPAGVHRAGNLRGKGKPGFLLHRQRVVIAAQQHGSAIVSPPAQDRDEAGGRGAFMDFERQPGERGLQFFGGARAVQPDFRIGVDRTAQLNHLVEPRVADGAPVGGGFESHGLRSCV